MMILFYCVLFGGVLIFVEMMVIVCMELVQDLGYIGLVMLLRGIWYFNGYFQYFMYICMDNV